MCVRKPRRMSTVRLIHISSCSANCLAGEIPGLGDSVFMTTISGLALLAAGISNGLSFKYINDVFVVFLVVVYCLFHA